MIKLWKKHAIRIHSMLEKNEIPIFRFSIKTSLRTRNSWHRFSFFEGVKKYVVNATCIKDFVVFNTFARPN